MKNLKKIVLVLGAAVVVSGATVASAQETDLPDQPDQPVICQFNFGPQTNLDNFAELFDMTVEELQAALDEGQTIRDIATELGIELPLSLHLTGQQAQFGQTDSEDTDGPPFQNQNQNVLECADAGNRLIQLAELFDMTIEELQAALDEGQTIRDIAAELDVDLPVPPRGPQGQGQFSNQNGPQNPIDPPQTNQNGPQNPVDPPQANQNGPQNPVDPPQANQNGQPDEQQPPAPGNGGPQGPGNQNGQAGPPQGGPQGPQRPA